MKGFKAFDKDLKCRNMQFKVGKTYEMKEVLQICKSGFHFCEKAFDVYSYYGKSTDTRICEVEALGEVQTEGDKSVTNKIKILRELTDVERLNLWINRTNSGDWNSGYGNSGDWNSGYGNSGDWNSGDRNSGDRNSGYGNSGDRNSGDWNSGDWNSGDWNSGDRNSGDRNSGDRNSGYGNSGDRNSGDWNSGYGNSGYFNTTTPVYLFNKPSDVKYTKELENQLRSLNVKPILTYIYTDSMTDEEKANNPSYKVTGGFLRKTDRMNWTQLTENDKKFILSLPNYDDEVFKQISGGVSLLEPKTIKVIHDGREIEIDLVKAKELGIIK